MYRVVVLFLRNQRHKLVDVRQTGVVLYFPSGMYCVCNFARRNKAFSFYFDTFDGSMYYVFNPLHWNRFLRMATNGITTESVPKTEPEPVTKTETVAKVESDTGAGDAPERTPDHAKLLENKLSVEIANKLDDIFKTGSYPDVRCSSKLDCK